MSSSGRKFHPDGTDPRPGLGDGPREFPTTSWSLIRTLQRCGPGPQRGATVRFVQLYWAPVYVVIRRFWGKSDQDARDLTQEFFERAVLGGTAIANYQLGRGSFRSFLKGALKNFLSNQERHATRQRRGGAVDVFSFDDPRGAAELEAWREAEGSAPDEMVDSVWRRLVLARAFERVEARFRAADKQDALEVFRRYTTGGAGRASYEAIAEAMRLTVDQVKHALVHTRAAFKDAVIEIVRDLVETPEDLAAELSELFGPSWTRERSKD